MLPMLIASLLLLTLSDAARAQLLHLLTGGASTGSRTNWPLAALLVTCLLFMTVNPEARVFLMFVDAVGVDFFVLLLTLQLRAWTGLCWDVALIPTVRHLKRLAPFPMQLPTVDVLKDFPDHAACAVVGSAFSAVFLLTVALAVLLPMTALVRDL
jgi:hypothetical protein